MNTPVSSPHDATRRSIFHIDFTEADGVRHRKTIRCPSWERDPEASLIGLNARLASLTLDAVITRSSVSVPEHPRHLKACIDGRGTKGHRCSCFPRWTEVEVLKS
jgi:hypothetical protein